MSCVKCGKMFLPCTLGFSDKISNTLKKKIHPTEFNFVSFYSSSFLLCLYAMSFTKALEKNVQFFIPIIEIFGDWPFFVCCWCVFFIFL